MIQTSSPNLSTHMPDYNTNLFLVHFNYAELTVLLMERVDHTGDEYVKFLVQQDATWERRERLVNMMSDMVELIDTLVNTHNYWPSDIALCNIGFRSLSDSNALVVDLDRFIPAPDGGKLKLKELKKMLMIPYQVAMIVLQNQVDCHESWKKYNWFHLKEFFNGADEIDLSTFRVECRRLLYIDVPQPSSSVWSTLKTMLPQPKMIAGPKAASPSSQRSSPYHTPAQARPSSILSDARSLSDDRDHGAGQSSRSWPVKQELAIKQEQEPEQRGWENWKDGNTVDTNSSTAGQSSGSWPIKQEQEPKQRGWVDWRDERRRLPAKLSNKQAPVGEIAHARIPTDAFVLVLNIALVLWNAIEDYIGVDVIRDEKIHRLTSLANFRKHKMLTRIYDLILLVSGHHSLHYNWNEWVNANVVKQVVEAEMKLLCANPRATDRHWKCACKYMQSFDEAAHKEILEVVMRNWPSYRHDAVTQIVNGTDIDNAQMDI